MTEPHVARPSCAGVITHWSVLAAGAVLTVVALGGWVLDAVRGA